MDKRLFAGYLLVSLLLICGLLLYFGPEKVALSLLEVSPVYYLAFALTLVGINLVMAFRIKYLLGKLGTEIGFIGALKAHLGGMFASDLTPARSGYFGTAALLAMVGVDGEKALLAIFAPQMFNFLAKVVLGSLALLVFAQQLNLADNGLIYLGLAVVLVFVATGFLVIFSRRFLAMFAFCERVPFAGSLLFRFYQVFVKMQEHSYLVKQELFVLLGFESALVLLKSLAWLLLGSALGIVLPVQNPFLFYFFLQALVIMFDFVPSPTVAGAGVTESALVFVLAAFGADLGAALTMGLLFRFTNVAIDLIGSLPVMRSVLDYVF